MTFVQTVITPLGFPAIDMGSHVLSLKKTSSFCAFLYHKQNLSHTCKHGPTTPGYYY